MKKEDKIIKIVEEVLGGLLSKIGVEAKNEIKVSEGVVFVNIKTEDPGALIGWHGNTLAALEHILRLLVARKTQQEDFIPLVLDVEGYKQKQRESLEQLAVAQTMQVRQTGEPIEFSPMSAYKRRIIHLALANFDDITTESIGEGAERRVVIKPVTVLNQKIDSGQTETSSSAQRASKSKQKLHKEAKKAVATKTQKEAKAQEEKSSTTKRRKTTKMQKKKSKK